MFVSARNAFVDAVLGTHGARRRHTIATGAPLVIATHRVLRPGAFTDLHLAEAVTVRVCLARDSVQEIMLVVVPPLTTFYTLGVAVQRTTSAGGARAMIAFTLFGAATLHVGSL